MIKRIKERRINYADVLEYLLNPNYEKSNGNENYGIFYTSSKTVIRNLIVQLLENKLEKGDSEIEKEREKTLNLKRKILTRFSR